MVNSYENYSPVVHQQLIGYQSYSSRNRQNNNPDVTTHAVGKYDIIPKFHMALIKKGLTDSGVSIVGKTNEEIVELFQNNNKAQDFVGLSLAEKELKVAEQIKKETQTNAPIPELAYFIHAFGGSNTRAYISILQSQGQEAADQWLYEKTNTGSFVNPIPSSAIERFRNRYNRLNLSSISLPNPVTPSRSTPPKKETITTKKSSQILPVTPNTLEQNLQNPDFFRQVMSNPKMFDPKLVTAYTNYYNNPTSSNLNILKSTYETIFQDQQIKQNRENLSSNEVGLMYQLSRGSSLYLNSEDTEHTAQLSSSIPIKVEEQGLQVLDVKPSGIYSFKHGFSLSEGATYIPLPNRGNSKEKDVYENVEGIAHFILDADLTNEYFHPNTVTNMYNMLTKGRQQDQFGGTVDDPMMPLYKKDENGNVNVTYRPLSELNTEPLFNEIVETRKKNYEGFTSPVVTPDGYKVFGGLRQYKFSDINWASEPLSKDKFPAYKGKAVGFAPSVKYLPTFPDKDGNIHPTYLIAGSGKDKKSYGQFGGATVVFMSKKADFAIDFSGSIEAIKKAGLDIIEKYNINPEDLILAYHDTGSFNAKLSADNNKRLKRSRYYDYNNDKWTGAALAIPASN